MNLKKKIIKTVETFAPKMFENFEETRHVKRRIPSANQTQI